MHAFDHDVSVVLYPELISAATPVDDFGRLLPRPKPSLLGVRASVEHRRVYTAFAEEQRVLRTSCSATDFWPALNDTAVNVMRVSSTVLCAGERLCMRRISWYLCSSWGSLSDPG